MVTTSHLVKKLLQNKPFILEGLSRGIISHGNLAEELKPKIEKELGKKVKDAAIIMSLRRYASEIQKINPPRKKFNFAGEIMMKTNICDFNVVKTPKVLERLKSFYKLVDLGKGDVLNIIIGNNEVSIVISDRFKERILKLLKGERILSKDYDLVSLSIIFTGDFIHTPGIIFETVRKLAWENINIYEVISTLTELTFIISKNDSMKAYEVLQELVSK